MNRSLTASLLAITADPVQRRRLAALRADSLQQIAEHLVEGDAYGSNHPMRAALGLIGREGPDVLTDHIAHHLWCTWRECRHVEGVADALDVVVRNEANVGPTDGLPTVLLVPMTLGPTDAVATLHRLAGERPFIVYGEQLSDEPPPWASHAASPGLAGLSEIISVLDGGGVFATFADFAYAGHRHEVMTLFERERPISSAFVGVVARADVRVLPVVCLRRAQTIEVVVRAPRSVPSGADRSAITDLLASELERLVTLAGEQWLLASTLVFDSPQAALV